MLRTRARKVKFLCRSPDKRHAVDSLLVLLSRGALTRLNPTGHFIPLTPQSMDTEQGY